MDAVNGAVNGFWDKVGGSPAYVAVAGNDMHPAEFFREALPYVCWAPTTAVARTRRWRPALSLLTRAPLLVDRLFYVSCVPLLVLIWRIVLVPSCNPSLIVHASYPPPAPNKFKSPGYRVMRRTFLAVHGKTKMAMSMLRASRAVSRMTKAEVGKGVGAKQLNAQANLTAQLNGAYGNAGRSSCAGV
jgi:hypothetical protein